MAKASKLPLNIWIALDPIARKSNLSWEVNGWKIQKLLPQIKTHTTNIL